MRAENKPIFPFSLSGCRIVEKKRYDKLNDAAYSALKYRVCAANFFIKGSDYICEELIPQCVSWRELRHLLELDGLTTLGGVYIHSLDLDQKRLDDELIGYNR